ncbi:MAG: hypothetical protein M1542_07945 [Thermotogae bacterium]|jgi:hypothetical protein|nr:hypothetical protein [Thermotogota bacterium]MCL5033157.1 hypothetical protein [Thermotogota bacterium]
MKILYFFILISGLSTLVLAVPINLEINANYYSHTLEFTGTFAATNVGVNLIPKNFVSSQISTSSSVTGVSSLIIQPARNNFALSTLNGTNFPAKTFQKSQYNFSIDNSSEIGFNFETPILSGLMNYNYNQAKMSNLSLGFNIGSLSTLGFVNSKCSSISLTFPNGFSVEGNLTDQSTTSISANLPINLGSFIFDVGGRYIVPSQFKPKLYAFYMGNDLMPYAMYDTKSTPTITAGLNSSAFSFYGKMTLVSTPLYSIGSSYRSPLGVLGADFSIQSSQNYWVDGNFSSIPFGFSFLQFGIGGDVKLENSGTYLFNIYTLANLNVFSTNVESWFGLRGEGGAPVYYYGMDVNF